MSVQRRWLEPIGIMAVVLLSIEISHPDSAIATSTGSRAASLDPAVVRLIEERATAVAAATDNADLHGELGLVYEANLLWSEARASYARAHELEPEDDVWIYRLGLATLETGDLESAAAIFELVEPSAAEYPAALQRLGQTRMNLADTDAARRSFERLTDVAPDRVEGWLGLGAVAVRERRFEAAIAPLEHGLSLDPDLRAAHYQLGLAYRGVGRLEDAERELALGVDALPRLIPDPLAERLDRYAVFLTARLQEAGGLLRQGDLAGAALVLEETADRHPDNVTVLNDLAIVYLRQDRLDEARLLLDRARKLNDARFSTYINLVSWAQRSRQPQQALEFADAAVARGPRVAETHAARARVLYASGRLEAAARSLDRAAALDPNNPQLLLALADLERQLDDLPAALDRYRQVSERWPQALRAHLGRARTALALGDRRETEAGIEALRSLAPDHPALADLTRALADLPSVE